VTSSISRGWLAIAWTHDRQTQDGLPAGDDASLASCRTELLRLDGDRAEIRARTVAIALQRLLAAARDGGLADRSGGAPA